MSVARFVVEFFPSGFVKVPAARCAAIAGRGACFRCINARPPSASNSLQGSMTVYPARLVLYHSKAGVFRGILEIVYLILLGYQVRPLLDAARYSGRGGT